MNAYYKIYLEGTIALAKSMIIKSEVAARLKNKEEEGLGYSISTDQRQWRYYKNLNGDYHHLDEPMKVISLDVVGSVPQWITFDKETLKIHKKTFNVYLNTPSYAAKLKQRYPTQTVLIDGILRPIPYEVSIPAKDCTILYYDPKYVEKQEYLLIPETEKWIRGFMYRYMMESYLQTNDLFAMDMFGKMFAMLPKKIMGIRAALTKTAQTHSFHIRMYLASHNRLDEFMPYFTYEQLRYFYMNIAYLERHTGMQSNFDALIHNLMTVRRLPVYDYTLQQQALRVDEGELNPDAVFVRRPINLNTMVLSRGVDEAPISEIVYKEVPDAKHNTDYVGDYLHKTEELMGINQISKLPTKILEASAIDPEDVAIVKQLDMLVNHWAYLATTGNYRATVEVLNPISGDLMKLTMKELFTLYVYAFYAGHYGHELKGIPEYLAIDLTKMRWIDYSEYARVVPADKWNKWDPDIDFFQRTYKDQPATITSADEFVDFCNELIELKRRRHMYVYQPQRFEQKAVRESLYNYSHTDIKCDLKTPQYKTYDEFFTYLGFDRTLMYAESWTDLALTCLDLATLFSSRNAMSLREIQAAMVRVFKRLSSYTVQLVEEIVSSDTIVTNNMMVITNETPGYTTDGAFIDFKPIEIVEAKGRDLGHLEKLTCNVRAMKVDEIVDNSYDIDVVVGALVTGTEHVVTVLTMNASTFVSANRVSADPLELMRASGQNMWELMTTA